MYNIKRDYLQLVPNQFEHGFAFKHAEVFVDYFLSQYNAQCVQNVYFIKVSPCAGDIPVHTKVDKEVSYLLGRKQICLKPF